MKLDVEMSAVDPNEKFGNDPYAALSKVVGCSMAIGLGLGLAVARSQWQGYYFFSAILGIMVSGTFAGTCYHLLKTPSALKQPGAWKPKHD